MVWNLKWNARRHNFTETAEGWLVTLVLEESGASFTFISALHSNFILVTIISTSGPSNHELNCTPKSICRSSNLCWAYVPTTQTGVSLRKALLKLIKVKWSYWDLTLIEYWIWLESHWKDRLLHTHSWRKGHEKAQENMITYRPRTLTSNQACWHVWENTLLLFKLATVWHLTMEVN